MVFFPKVSLSLSRRSFIAFVVLRRKTFPRRKTFSCPPISALSECVKITDFMFISSNTRVRVKAKRESSASSVFGTRSTEIIVRSVLNTRVFFNSLTLCVLRCEQHYQRRNISLSQQGRCQWKFSKLLRHALAITFDDRLQGLRWEPI